MRTPSRPLSKAEVQCLHEKAHSVERKLRHHIFLPIDIIPYTGLYPAEYCHLTREWVTFPEELDWDSDDPILIRVPEAQDCPQVRLEQGNVQPTDRPCPHCRKTAGADRWERRYESRDRTIEVMAEPARDALESWFAVHDAIPHSVPSLSENITKLAREAGFDRSITATSLRKTYPVMLVRMGFPLDYIIDVAGYSCKARLPDEALEAFREREGESSRDILPTSDLLRHLKQSGSVGTGEMAKELDWPRGVLYQHLTRLEEMGIVEQATGHGRQLYWKFDDDPDSALNCPYDGCSKSYSTLRSLSIHVPRSHSSDSAGS